MIVMSRETEGTVLSPSPPLPPLEELKELEEAVKLDHELAGSRKGRKKQEVPPCQPETIAEGRPYCPVLPSL